jgi:hypothetical protein
MPIQMPRARAYYLASENEPDYLLCWIPADELARLAGEGRLAPETLEDYPEGLELEVSSAAFEELGLDLGLSPEEIKGAYAGLRQAGALPQSGMVDGARLEAEARGLAAVPGDFEALGAPLPFSSGTPLPEPEMTDGEDARTVMQRL